MGKPSLYVVVRASYKEYEADLARVRGIAREQGEAISNALNNSISPKQAIKGFESLSVSLQKAIGAANAFNVKPQIKGLDELAKIAGVSAERMDYFTQAMVKTARENSLERSLQSLQKQTGMSQLAMAKFRYELGDFSGALRTVGSIAMSAAIPIAAFGTAAFLMGKSCLDAQLALQRLNVAYQSVFEGGAGAQLDFIYQQTQKIGLEFQSTAEAAKGFFAAGRDSTLAPELNNIFSAVTSASGALQLSGEQVNRTFLALGQMISKGKVQAEELRGQLGEQLPGAFQLAAKAMGMTTAELDKFMADGKLTAEDLLPKLADALNDKYAKAAEEAGNKSQAAINRMSTEWSLFKANVLNSEDVISVLNRVTGALNARNVAAAADKERNSLISRLQGMGVGPDASGVSYDDQGNKVESKYYSENFLNSWRNFYAEQAAADKFVEDQEALRAKTIAEGRKARDEALKDTPAFKISALQKEKSEALDKVKASIAEYQQLGEDTSVLEKDLITISDTYDKKIADINNKGAKSAIAAAKAENGYAAAVAETTAQIAGYQQQLSFDKSESLGRAKAKIESEYQQAVAKTTKEIENQVVAKKITASEGDTLMQLKMQSLELKKQVEIREAEERAREKEIQMVGDQLNFYKELGELSGQYGNQLDMQVKLIELQASKYEDVLKIPKELVEQWKKYKLLQESYDPWDGAYRGLVKFTAEYSNEAKQWENITYSWATGFNDTTKDMWGDFLDTGKVSFDKLSLSFTKLLKDMSYQALVQPIVLSIVGMARDSIYSATSAGQSGGGSGGSSNVYGMASGMAQQYATNKLMSGATSAFGDTINGWAASAFPNTFAPNAAVAAYNAPLTGGEALLWEGVAGQAPTALGPTNTLTGSMGTMFNPYTIGGGAVGSIGASYLSPAILGNSQSVSTGTTIGSAAGMGIGTALILANGWNPVGWAGAAAMGIGALLGGVGGGGIGSMFGGGGSEPGLWLDTNLNLLGDMDQNTIMSIVHPNRSRGGFSDAGGMGYYVQARSRNGMDYSASTGSSKYLGQLAQQTVALSTSVRDTLESINSGLGTQYIDALRPMAWLHAGADGEGGDSPTAEQVGKSMVNLAYGRIAAAVSQTDLSKIAIAADGMVADTMGEVTTAITKAVSVANIGASMGDYQSKFVSTISDKLLQALNTLDLRNMALAVDTSSLAGWQAAATAIQTMDGVKTSLNSILAPASELSTAMDTANAQMNSWIESLRALGWQESAIADIESRRSAYMDTYYQAIARGAEQNIYLRSMALSAGTDSWAYQSQSLRYQQENELTDAKKKYGTDSDIYKTLVATQQAESIQAEIDYLQKQYDSMLQEQISSAQSLVNSFDRVVDSLDEARRNIWNSDANISTSRLADARADFSTVYAKAMAGDADAMAQLPSLSTSLLQLGKEQLASRSTYEDLFYDVDRKLKDAQGIAKNKYDVNQAQLTALQSQLSTQQAGNLTLAEISGKITTLSSSLATMMTDLMSMSQITKEAQASTTNLWGTKADATQSQMDKLLADKAAQANAQASGGRTNWTASDIAQNIAKAGESVESWWAKYGVAEAVPTTYTSTTSQYGSDMALLAAKAADANKYAADGKTNWTAADIAQNIANAGMTISEWYARHGKAEGYAAGGITPANEPFWVGEKGPELVVSPQQWGVINNSDSMALMRGMRSGGGMDSASVVAAINNMNDTLRQLLTKTDRIMADQGRIRDRMDMFAQEGVTIAAA